MEIVTKLLEFFPRLDDKTKLLFTIFVILAVLAYKVIGDKLSQGAKLAVFFAVFFVGSGVALVALYSVASTSAKDGAQPPGALPTPSALGVLGVTFVVHAQDQSGWVYCGKFDEETRRSRVWARNVEPAGTSKDSLPSAGSRLKTVSITDVYYDHPRFTALGLKWALASVKLRIPAGTELTVKSCQLFADNGWCEVD